MKTKIFLFISFILLSTKIVIPQNSLSTPLNYETRLAKSLLAPEQFLIAMNDTVTQTIINPAAGFISSRQFSYLSYFGTSQPEVSEIYSENKSFSSISLFNALGKKLYMVVQHNLNKRNQLIDYSSDYGTPTKSEVLYGTQNFQFKLLSLGGTVSSGFALGIFLNYQQTDGNDIAESHSSDFTYSQSLNEGRKDNFTKVQFGVEYGYVDNLFNYHGNISFQKTNGENENFYKLFYSSSNIEQSQKYYTLNEQKSTIIYNPETISFDNNLHLKTGLIAPDDYFYLGFLGYYSKTDASKSIVDNYQTYDSYNPGHNYNYYSTDATDNWGFITSAGYTVQTTTSGVEIISGLQVKFSRFDEMQYGIYSQNIYLSSVSIRRKFDRLDFILPVIISYSPVKSISVFGGLVYNYYFSQEKLGYNRTQLNNIPFTEYINREYNDSYSSTVLRLGAEFLNYKGINIYVLFNDDLSNYKVWNVSLGYHF